MLAKKIYFYTVPLYTTILNFEPRLEPGSHYLTTLESNLFEDICIIIAQIEALNFLGSNC